jgi:outer membrane protein assembly complex protein YaeT
VSGVWLAVLVTALAVPRGQGNQPSSAQPAAESEKAPVVGSVELRLPPGEDEAAVRKVVTIPVGEPLSRRAVRRTVLSLYATGRFANVLVSLEPEGTPGRVRVVITCPPRRVVGQLEVVDAARPPALDLEHVRRAAGLGKGDELWPGHLDEVAERVREALARRGRRSARVQATAEGEGEADVRLAIDEGPVTRVASLSLTGSGDPQRFADALATRQDSALDLDVLDGDVKALRARLRHDGFLRARIGTPAVTIEGERADVQIPVDVGPRIEFRFLGAATFPTRELGAQLALENEQALDAPAIQGAAGRVRGFYWAHGYAAARVSAAERPMGKEIAIVFTVSEGRRYRLRDVRFPGASPRRLLRLREQLDEALQEIAPEEERGIEADAERLARASGSPAQIHSRPSVDPREVWNPPVWDEAVLRLIDQYKGDGYLDAAHEGTRVTLDAGAGAVDVEIRVREGVQTRVEAVTFEGEQGLTRAELERELKLGPGDPFAYGTVEASRAALLALYGHRGYAYARVTESEELSPDHTKAAVRFRVEEGPQVRVGNVIVSGARRTKESVIRDALALHPGDVYDPDLAARSQAGLLRLGVFRSVGLRLSDPDAPEATKDLNVDVAERPYQTLAQGVGFSIANGPRAFVEFTRPNLFGRALEFTARAKVNYPIPDLRADKESLEAKAPLDRVEGHGEIGLRDPLLSIFGFGSGARATGIAERLHRPAYDLSRGAVAFGLDVPLSTPVLLSLQYELEVDHINKSQAAQILTIADVERLRFPEGITTLQSFRPVLALDLRDSTVHPRRGLLATSTFEYTHSIDSSALFGLVNASGNYQNFLKLSAAVTGYVPLRSQGVLALSLRGGRILKFGTFDTIPPKRFFLGGASSMRGYGEDEMVPEDLRKPYLSQIGDCATSLSGLACSQVARQLASGQTLISPGAEAFLIAKAELRFPLFQSLEGGLFADLGNLWLDPTFFSFSDLRLNVGAGLRFLTPIGPAVLDIGFNPSADSRLGEPSIAPHFSIGLF